MRGNCALGRGRAVMVVVVVVVLVVLVVLVVFVVKGKIFYLRLKACRRVEV